MKIEINKDILKSIGIGLIYYIIPQFIILFVFSILGVEFIIKRLEPMEAMNILEKSHSIMFFICNIVGALVYGIKTKEMNREIRIGTMLIIILYLLINLQSYKIVNYIMLLILVPSIIVITGKIKNPRTFK